MSDNRVTYWVTVATNIAVLASVLLLVYEIRQNNDLAELQATQERRHLGQQSDMIFYDPRISEVWVKSIMEPENMTLAEIRSMDAYLAVQVWQMSHIWDLEQAGLKPEGETRVWMEDGWDFVFANTFAKTWWEVNGGGWSHLQDEGADEIVASFDPNQTRRDLETIQRLLQERATESVD